MPKEGPDIPRYEFVELPGIDWKDEDSVPPGSSLTNDKDKKAWVCPKKHVHGTVIMAGGVKYCPHCSQVRLRQGRATATTTRYQLAQGQKYICFRRGVKDYKFKESVVGEPAFKPSRYPNQNARKLY